MLKGLSGLAQGSSLLTTPRFSESAASFPGWPEIVFASVGSICFPLLVVLQAPGAGRGGKGRSGCDRVDFARSGGARSACPSPLALPCQSTREAWTIFFSECSSCNIRRSLADPRCSGIPVLSPVLPIGAARSIKRCVHSLQAFYTRMLMHPTRPIFAGTPRSSSPLPAESLSPLFRRGRACCPGGSGYGEPGGFGAGSAAAPPTARGAHCPAGPGDGAAVTIRSEPNLRNASWANRIAREAVMTSRRRSSCYSRVCCRHVLPAASPPHTRRERQMAGADGSTPNGGGGPGRSSNSPPSVLRRFSRRRRVAVIIRRGCCWWQR